MLELKKVYVTQHGINVVVLEKLPNGNYYAETVVTKKSLEYTEYGQVCLQRDTWNLNLGE